MIEITTKIVIKGKSPLRIFNWLRNLNKERYRQWHSAHRYFDGPTILDIGSVIYFEEVIDDFKVHYKWKIVDLKIGSFILMKTITFYPIYLSLSLSSINENTEVVHSLKIGFVYHGLEKIFDWFLKKFILHSKRIEAIKRHALEEFKNLENIL